VRENCKQALVDISKMMHVMKLFAGSQSETSVSYDPSLAYRPQIFNDGLLFLLRVEVIQEGHLKSMLVLAGGEYTSRVHAERRAQDPVPHTEICAFGINISLENLAQLYHTRRSEEVHPPYGMRTSGWNLFEENYIVFSSHSSHLHGIG